MIPDTKHNLDHIYDYYCNLRTVGRTERSIYEIWESGGAFNDSVTPSTYVPEYRRHIVRKILNVAPPFATIISLGCGNGFVEGDLVSFGRAVQAIDCNEKAVRLTRKKGVDACVADFFDLEPSRFEDMDVIYADGLLGHLFDADEGIGPAFDKLASVGLRRGAHLVFSNDSPRDAGLDFAAHESVEGFWFLSKAYLSRSLRSFGFTIVESYYFPYRRPLSGIRNRTICVARVP